MPVVPQPAVLWTCATYLLVLLGIGFWAARRTRDTRDFFIAGQSVGLLVTGLTMMSAAFSGFVFVGGPGLTYRLGAASFFVFVPVGFTSGLLCWVVARPLRRLAAGRDVYTVPDAILARYRSRLASGLAALAVLLGTVAYLGVQLQALGVVLESVFGFGGGGLVLAMVVGVAVIVAYSMAGGMIAGVYTDLFQGVLMLFAAGAVFLFAHRAGGGLGRMAETIAGSDGFGAGFLDPLGSIPVFTAMGFFFVFSVGTLGQPQMLHKFYMLDDPRKLRWMPAVIGLSQGVCVLVWLGIGLAVPALVASGELPALDKPDQAAAVFLSGFVPDAAGGLVLAAVLAAIMSTADSFVNIGSAALVRDLPKALGHRPSEGLLWGRLAVLAVAASAAVFSYIYGDLIALLGTFAFGVFGAALAPAIAIGLNWEGVTARAAVASIATGLVLCVALELLTRADFLAGWPRPPLPESVLPSAVALAASFTVLFAMSLAGRRIGRW